KMYIMSLIVQSLKGSAHADDVIIGVRREDDHSFWIGLRTFGMCGQVNIGLSSGPSGDGIAKQIINLQIDLVSITFFYNQITQSKFVIIIIGERKNWLLKFQGHVYYGLFDHLGSPFD